MALVVEDGTGKVDAEAYRDVAGTDLYLASLYQSNGLASKWLGAKAEGTIQLAAQPSDAETLTLDGKAYRFKTALALAGDVLIGTAVGDTRANLFAALTLGAGSGSAYHAGTTAHPTIEALNVDNARIYLRARLFGAFGNSLACSETMASPLNTVTAALAGGADSGLSLFEKEECLRAGAQQGLDATFKLRWRGSRVHEDQALDWPRGGDYDGNGNLLPFDAVPDAIGDANSEAAVRWGNETAGLIPDLANAGVIQSESKKLGPMEKSVTYMGGKSPTKSFPVIDALVRAYVWPAGRSVRG